MRDTIIPVFIILSYYILGAYATTDIVRLTNNSPAATKQKNCYCPQCHTILALYEQIPIISYFFQKGRCRHCHCKIPKTDILLEVGIFTCSVIVVLITGFSFSAFFLLLIMYELLKLVLLLFLSKKEAFFRKRMIYSFLHNILFFSLQAFMFLLYQIVR